MKLFNLALTAAVLAISSSANASSLQSRLGGLAYYDDVANLTWLADANYAATSGYAAANVNNLSNNTNNVYADGRMGWQAANDWAAGLTVDGVTGWRLTGTLTLQPDASCSYQIGSESRGYNCIGSEMGNLFYNVLGIQQAH